MDRRITPPKRVTSPAWGPPHPCKQALTLVRNLNYPENGFTRLHTALTVCKIYTFLVKSR